MRYIISYFVFVGLSLSWVGFQVKRVEWKRASDAYIRDRVFLLGDDKHGHCTGVQVRLPSGKTVMMTAEHCKLLLVDDATKAVDEEGKEFTVVMLAIDPTSDLMIMTSADDRHIDIADSVYKHEHVHTLTHGGGLPTYRTDGELLDEKQIHVVRVIENDEELAACPKTKDQEVVMDLFGILCQRTLTEMISNAPIAAGSSGGPVLDSDGKLVGIVSAGDGVFSDFVPLHNIQDFVKSL